MSRCGVHLWHRATPIFLFLLAVDNKYLHETHIFRRTLLIGRVIEVHFPVYEVKGSNPLPNSEFVKMKPLLLTTKVIANADLSSKHTRILCLYNDI